MHEHFGIFNAKTYSAIPGLQPKKSMEHSKTHIVEQNLEQELYPTAGVFARCYVKLNLPRKQCHISSMQSTIEMWQFDCFGAEGLSYRCTLHSEMVHTRNLSTTTTTATTSTSTTTTNNDYNDAATLPLTTEAGFRGVFVGALVLPV